MLMEKIFEPQAAVKYRDILIGVTSTAEDEAALNYAEDLAVSGEGHVVAMLVSPLPSIIYAVDASSTPIVWGEMINQCHEEAEEEARRLAGRLDRFSVPFEVRKLSGDLTLAAADSTLCARHADLAIFTRPDSQDDARHALIVAALFGAGRPVIVVPPNWKKGAPVRNVMVAWNASREAARALADAAPFLAAAESVRLVTVDARQSMSGHGDAPGEDIATHLARRGVKVDLVNLASGGEDDGVVIAAEAERFNADLLVLGAYGHSRLREMVFGGVTKHLLVKGVTPMLFSH